MAKRIEVAGEAPPYAELVIRPADPRPIVISLQTLGGDVEMSPGDSTDVATAHVVLAIMGAVTRSIGHVRLLKELNPPEQSGEVTGADDIPF